MNKELTQQELIRVFSDYLPYDIKFKHIDHGYDFTNPKEIITEIDAISKDWISFKDGADYYFKRSHDDDFIEVKPILWDLSMLTQEIEHEGEAFIPLHKILEEYCFDLSKMYDEEILSYAESLIQIDMSFKTANMLLEWHFNILNLDESQYINKATCK